MMPHLLTRCCWARPRQAAPLRARACAPTPVGSCVVGSTHSTDRWARARAPRSGNDMTRYVRILRSRGEVVPRQLWRGHRRHDQHDMMKAAQTRTSGTTTVGVDDTTNTT